jgi:HSP20 family molecular chaperone IbpA
MKTQLASVHEDFRHLAQQMGKMMDQMVRRSFVPFRPTETWRPAVNFYEANDRYLLCVDLAGMDRRQIDVHTEGQSITVSGARPSPLPQHVQGELRMHVMEIDDGPFAREVSIPADVDRSDITARYANGYLWIDLPKAGRESDVKPQ